MKKSVVWHGSVFLGLLVILAGLVNYVLMNKTSAENYKPFFDEKEQYDVLFLGASSVVSGISPLDLWKEYGIVSYNLANNGQALCNNYYVLEQALKTQIPKVVVVDLAWLAMEDTLKGSGYSFLHQFLDFMPMGETKLNAIWDLVPEDRRTEFLFPILLYHTRWKELDKRDFQSISSINKGGNCAHVSYGSDGEIFDTSVFAEDLKIVPREETENYPERNDIYIEKMVSLCKEKGVEILFVNLPSYAYGKVNHGDGETLQKMWNQFYVTAERLDVDYVNGMHHIDEMELDFVEDLRDWRHYNIFGNRKITKWMGEYLQNEYEISNRSQEESLAGWNTEYEEWKEFEENMLKRYQIEND